MHEKVDSTNLVTIIEVRDEFHATALVAGLEDNGIKSTMTGVYSSGFKAEAPGMVKVVVRLSDLEKAKKVLDYLEQPVDWNRVNVGDPIE